MLLAEAAEITAAQARAAAAAARLGNTAVLAAVAAEVTGRRGPGMPAPRSGSPAGPRARPPGSRPASRWMSRRAAPRWPGSWRAAPGTRTGTRAPAMMSCSGLICAWDRVEARASADKHAAVAELARRRSAAGPRWCRAGRRCRGVA